MTSPKMQVSQLLITEILNPAITKPQKKSFLITHYHEQFLDTQPINSHNYITRFVTSYTPGEKGENVPKSSSYMHKTLPTILKSNS